MHHTFTNVHGLDRDLGYAVLRVSPDQPWRPENLLNPFYFVMLALLFEYGVALHDVETEDIASGRASLADKGPKLAEVWQKVRSQILKDYVLFPLLAGPQAPAVAVGNAAANVVRNIWAFTIIFCGHFPEGIDEFTEAEIENETRGDWYLRQMLGSANLTGSKLFHIMSGNLSHQIEHHIFPDIPAHRYADLAVEVREICARYGLRYNAGPLSKQFGSVVRKIARLTFPGGGAPKTEGAEVRLGTMAPPIWARGVKKAAERPLDTVGRAA
jgi:fatty acid desaturase